MKTVKVSDLSGPALDWVVAKCEGWSTHKVIRRRVWVERLGFEGAARIVKALPALSYSSDWSLAGPVIEREGIELQCWRIGYRIIDHWTAVLPGQVNEEGNPIHDGPAPLIAAMRCYVASKLGDAVEIPEELV